MTNVDRTPRNTNMLIWHREVWLIDNGASIYVQYSGPGFQKRSQITFPQISAHVLLPYASQLSESDERLSRRLTADRSARDGSPDPGELAGRLGLRRS